MIILFSLILACKNNSSPDVDLNVKSKSLLGVGIYDIDYDFESVDSTSIFFENKFVEWMFYNSEIYMNIFSNDSLEIITEIKDSIDQKKFVEFPTMHLPDSLSSIKIYKYHIVNDSLIIPGADDFSKNLIVISTDSIVLQGEKYNYVLTQINGKPWNQ